MITFRRLLPAAVLLLSAQACVVSMDDLQPKTDEMCWQLEGFDTKACGPKCVSIYSPETGCGGPGCSPCDVSRIANAAAACDSAGSCTYTCVAGWGDCVNGSSDGCETFVGGYDSANCGACGRSCVNGCDAGVCNPVQQARTSGTIPLGIAVSGGLVYYADSSGAINRIDAGGVSVDVIPSYSPGPLYELVSDPTTNTLWASGTVTAAAWPYWALALYEVDFDFGPPLLTPYEVYPPSTSSAATSYVDGLAVSPYGTVVFTDSDYGALGYLSSLGTDWVYLEAVTGKPKGVVWHDGFFYFGYSDAGGTLSWAMDLSGSVGEELVMATGAGTPSRLAVYDDGSSYPLLFWASEDDGSVRVMELKEGPPEIFLVQGPTGRTSRMAITADVDGVYWSNRDTGLVSGWRAWDGRVLDLGYSSAPWAISTLGTNVVWTDDVAQEIYAVSK